LAGLVLEIGLQSMSGFSTRLIADILLTVLTALGTTIIPIREKFSKQTRQAPTGPDISATTAKRDRFSKGF